MDQRMVRLLDLLNIRAVSARPVPGGDINDSFRITDEEGNIYFLKINREESPKEIITAEAEGLDMMKELGVKIIPQNYRSASTPEEAGLLMPFYESRSPDAEAWIGFFEALARMHLITSEYFGGRDNFIGSLPQVNTHRNNWANFYRDHRLQPQLEKAGRAGYFTKKEQKEWPRLHQVIAALCPVEKPSLIHGDLWNGNILSTAEGILLIDPCPYFGHREMDLGMMSLFSGFPVESYIRYYNAVYPLAPKWEDRMEVYQLYYLLVHLNLFGTAYLPGVKRIIRQLTE